MEQWTDQAIVLSARPHGENGAIVSLLTENNGRHAGFVHGAQSSKKRAVVEPGSHVKAQWSARTSDGLGTFTLEADRGMPFDVLNDAMKLSALLSACSLCDAALPEREGHAGLYHGLCALMASLDTDHWNAAYVMWEISLLRELGFHLELDKCAGGGDVETLSHVSPKSGRAVSQVSAEPYKDKLLPLPNFLRPTATRHDSAGDDADILTGLEMTGYFLEHWVFIHSSKGFPEPRLRFQGRYAKLLGKCV